MVIRLLRTIRLQPTTFRREPLRLGIASLDSSPTLQAFPNDEVRYNSYKYNREKNIET